MTYQDAMKAYKILTEIESAMWAEGERGPLWLMVRHAASHMYKTAEVALRGE